MVNMPLSYDQFFREAFGPEPFHYQCRLALEESLPSLVNVPTGAGKTAAVLGAWLWRRLKNPASVGRRLIYCLPMRTLVEQTVKVAAEAVNRLRAASPQLFEKDPKRFEPYVLMGGDVTDEWDSYPERECILIGTQDMLLSRALNRGYAMSRFRWPVHFGLLNNDCLWVLDEVQLMGSGLATSMQLQAFRRLFGSFGKVQTIWMSATIEPDWLKTVDADLKQDARGEFLLDLAAETAQTLHDVMQAKKVIQKAKAKAGDTAKLAKEVVGEHEKRKKRSRTLVVVNTVRRAVELHAAIIAEMQKKRLGKEPILIHSRFRPNDRKQRINELLKEPDEGGTIIVSTQVIEAGIDVSARTLFTELAPWPSLVQRFGRCNRRGKDDDATTFWIDVPTGGKNSLAAPYDEKDMKLARDVLKELDSKDVGPMALKQYADSLSIEKRASLFQYEHIYVIRQHDLHGLFSTEPDLAGGYTDISMFVRNIERESDVYLYWRKFKDSPSPEDPPPDRNELCSVRFYQLKDLLGQKGVAWQWNSEVGKWEPKRANEIRPGMTLLLATSQGGYHKDFGWTGKAVDKPQDLSQTNEALSDPETAKPQESLSDELPSQTDWLTVPDHLRDTKAEAVDLIGKLQFEGGLWIRCSSSVIKGAWWHDVGKTISRWQRAGWKYIEDSINKAREFLNACPDSAAADFVREFLKKLESLSADSDQWAKFPDIKYDLKGSKLPANTQKQIKRALNVSFRPGLRHEAASALAAWKEWQRKVEGWTALAVYLVACHHGKVRTVLRSTRSGNDVFGIESGDELPPLTEWLPSQMPLDLRPKVFGAVGEWDDSQNLYLAEMPSWVEMVAELLGPELPDDPEPHGAIPKSEPCKLGPFRLAFLEALIRAADVRASRQPGKGRREMSKKLQALSFEGIRPDSLGNYLAGLGLLAVLSRKWPGIRGGWHSGCFVVVGEEIERDQIEKYLLKEWTPSLYERWWTEKQKADTKAKSDQNIWKARSSETISKVRLLDSHIVGVSRNQFNPVLGTGGNIGKRDLAKVFKDACNLLKTSGQQEVISWLRTTLFSEFGSPLPKLNSAGTWFVHANKTFNSGQSWYREGQISPWAFLLALEGALLLVGGVARRLGANARRYAVFPFVADAISPASETEVGLAKAEFWSPLWSHPASLAEARALLERGLARIGERGAKAPHEFAIAARAAGVDAGVAEFIRFVLRQTTSSQVYEAIPGERIEVGSAQSLESQLIEPIIPWIDRLPFEPHDSKQKGKFKGLRGPVEEAIIRIAEQPNNPERWQRLLLSLADAQARIDRNKDLRERCLALPWLEPSWFEKAWPSPPLEIQVARAITSIGAGTEMPVLVNVFGVELDKRGAPTFSGERRPQRAIWHSGNVARLLADVLERRLVDTDASSSLPLSACRWCSSTLVSAFLSAALDDEEIGRWIPPLSLINWSKSQPSLTKENDKPQFDHDGAYLMQALFRPLFYPHQLQVDGNDLFPNHLRPKAAIARRLLNLIRQGEWGEAVQLAQDRYLAAGRSIVVPPNVIGADNERLAASLLIPMRRVDIARGLSRWLQPTKNYFGGERK